MQTKIDERIRHEIRYYKTQNSALHDDVRKLENIVQHNSLRIEQINEDLEKSLKIIDELKSRNVDR